MMIESKKHINIKNILSLFLLIGTLFFSVCTNAAETSKTTTTTTKTTTKTNSGGTAPKQTCQKASCANAFKSCHPTTNASGYFTTTSGPGISSSCMKGELDNSDSCFNSLPVSYGGSFNTIGYRPNGAGPNPNPRNHYGSDIGGSNKPDISVYAAADGTVKYIKTSGGGGRTIAIEHKKACQATGGDSQFYKTTYRHLLAYKVSIGDTVYRKDPKTQNPTVIGIEGGSNAKSQGSSPCDNKAQAGMPGYTRAGCGSNYAIHLHFEVEDGPVNTSTTQAKASQVMAVYCSDIQNLCGGCSINAAQCLGKGVSSVSDGTSANMDGIKGGGIDGEDAYAAEQTCDFNDYLDSASCTFCELFKKLFNAASVIAKTANEKLAVPSKKIVTLGFAIWICIYLLKQVSSYSGASTGEMLKGLLFQGCRVLVVIVALKGALYQIMDLTLNPVMMTGLSFAQSLNDTSNCNTDADYMQNILGYDSVTGYQKDSEGGLSRQMGGAILCSIKNLEDATGFMMKLGHYSICISIKERPWLNGFLPNLGYLSTGIFLWLSGLFILLTFPWCLVDCVLQLCVAAALIPCAIGAFAFKLTAKYIKIVWNFFINAMYNFVFMAVIVYIINNNLKQWIGYDENTPIDPTIFINPFTNNSLAWYGPGAVKMFAVCFFCWCFFDEAKNLADNFAQSPSLGGKHGIGRMVGGTVADAAKKYGLAPAAKVTAAVGKAAGQGLNSAFGNKARSGWNHMRGRAMAKFGGKEIKDEQGNTVGYQMSRKGLFGNTKYTATKDENGVWVYTKEYQERAKHDKYFKKQVDENGKTIGYTDEYGKKMDRHEITNEDGSKSIVYESRNSDGSLGSRIVTDENGKVKTYKRHKDANERVAVNKGTIKTVNDAFMKTRTVTNSDGSIHKTKTSFQNVSSQYLINKDGTTNMHAVRQIMAGSQDKQAAAMEIVRRHMVARGIAPRAQFDKNSVQFNDDGSITMMQKQPDGSVLKAHARFDEGQLVLRTEEKDSKGNIHIHKSNGIQTKVENYELQKDGTYTGTTKYSFSDKAHADNKYLHPLNGYGAWGKNIDKDQAMRGFDNNDFNEHVEQIRDNNKTNLEENLSAAEVNSRLKINPESQESRQTETPQTEETRSSESGNEAPNSNDNTQI